MPLGALFAVDVRLRVVQIICPGVAGQVGGRGTGCSALLLGRPATGCCWVAACATHLGQASAKRLVEKLAWVGVKITGTKAIDRQHGRLEEEVCVCV